MAGDRELYQQHMNAGHDAAWNHEWAVAISAYSKAIREFPEDSESHTSLGLALLNADRLDDALKVYMRAHELSPDDPTPLEKSADVLERMGRLKEAAQQYINVSEVYLGQRDLNKAIGNWERATRLTPGLVQIHMRLAQAYERIGDKKKAVREYLTLAYNFHRTEDDERAEKAVERALRLDKRNSQALNALRALKSGGDIALPQTDELVEPEVQADYNLFGDEDDLLLEEEAHSDPQGPLGEASAKALVMLAAHVMESGLLDKAGGDALQAMELQRQQHEAEAIDAYRRAADGLRHPALKLNLGALLLQHDQPEEAAQHLGEALVDSLLASGAMHGLGQAYFKMGKHRQALRYLLQSVQAVDTSLALGQAEATELAQVYDRLQNALEGRPDDALEAINARLLNLLTGVDWKHRIAETRQHLDEVMRDQGDQGVVDFLGTGGSDNLASTVSRIDSYIRQNLLTLAMDEAHNAIQTSPYYLPVHVRMAEIMMREGRLRQAINKYNMVARAYMVRGEKDRAASILYETLETAPLDVSVRLSLIDLLESEDKLDEALDQYIELGKTYTHLGSFDKSRETFQYAERLAKQVSAPKEKLVIIRHSAADAEQLRMDTRSAIRIYEDIIELAPEDERALRMLVDLNYSQLNQLEAIDHLDRLLRIFAKRKQISRIVHTLEELTRHYPTDPGLRSRLAAMYRQLGRKADAINQLDALGELQIDIGMLAEARGTIRQIIALEPENVDDYKRLLQQIEDRIQQKQ